MTVKKTKSANPGPRPETPLMRQYRAIKDRHPGTILLFRMGDFYETFEEDARRVHSILGITLTRRSNGKATDVALAGFPHHAIDTYLPKLVEAGLRVAICEQLEDPKDAKSIVKRDVVEIVSPGVTFRDQLLDPRRSRYVAAISHGKRGRVEISGVAFADISTGEFYVTETDGEDLDALIDSIAPAELLLNKRDKDRDVDRHSTSAVETYLDDWSFEHEFARQVLTDHFGTHSLKGYGIETMDVGISAAGAVLHYLSESQKGRIGHVRSVRRYEISDHMLLDGQTRRNLELVSSIQTGGTEGTLVAILDESCTAMGARTLRKWLFRPLNTTNAIQSRLDAVRFFFSDPTMRKSLRETLSQVGDLERIAVKISASRVSPRDLAALKASLDQIPVIIQHLEGGIGLVSDAKSGLDPCSEISEMISRALIDNPPAAIKEGGVIRDGYNAELDKLREISRSGKNWLTELQQKEAEKTGISSLKVGFNKVFGYYLEVTHTHKDRVPQAWIRKQTLVNAERYITQELKEYEDQILGAEDRIATLEGELFQQIRDSVAVHTAVLLENARSIAIVDVLTTFAEVAVSRSFVEPVVTDELRIEIKEGRHPVVESVLPPGESFIPNDTILDTSNEQILIITGPNMAGKSVVLRQVGLIVLLAQVGCYVPAASASIGIVDRIFTRVGAADNLAAGESTFLVEMNETANILNSATEKSLILLDEVGRGTSTFDGLSIAWALVEYLHDTQKVAARTMFATHYHELNEIESRLERVHNYRIQVHEHDGKVVFLRRMIRGGADHSYGIDVARMAGIPEPVLGRAREILIHLESQRLRVEEALDETGIRKDTLAVPPRTTNQMSLFSDPADSIASKIRERVADMDTDRLTPLDALIVLTELKALTHPASSEEDGSTSE